jgi:hypothetical protein
MSAEVMSRLSVPCRWWEELCCLSREVGTVVSWVCCHSSGGELRGSEKWSVHGTGCVPRVLLFCKSGIKADNERDLAKSR